MSHHNLAQNNHFRMLVLLNWRVAGEEVHSSCHTSKHNNMLDCSSHSNSSLIRQRQARTLWIFQRMNSAELNELLSTKRNLKAKPQFLHVLYLPPLFFAGTIDRCPILTALFTWKPFTSLWKEAPLWKTKSLPADLTQLPVLQDARDLFHQLLRGSGIRSCQCLKSRTVFHQEPCFEKRFSKYSAFEYILIPCRLSIRDIRDDSCLGPVTQQKQNLTGGPRLML